jgi:hypothetical protein
MTRFPTLFLQLLILGGAAFVAACAQLGRDDAGADGPRPEVRYYVIADT